MGGCCLFLEFAFPSHKLWVGLFSWWLWGLQIGIWKRSVEASSYFSISGEVQYFYKYMLRPHHRPIKLQIRDFQRILSESGLKGNSLFFYAMCSWLSFHYPHSFGIYPLPQILKKILQMQFACPSLPSSPGQVNSGWIQRDWEGWLSSHTLSQVGRCGWNVCFCHARS